MKMYVETDNRLIKENDESKKDNRNQKQLSIENKKNAEILESYGLSKNAQILTE